MTVRIQGKKLQMLSLTGVRLMQLVEIHVVAIDGLGKRGREDDAVGLVDHQGRDGLPCTEENIFSTGLLKQYGYTGERYIQLKRS
jgi:hypothetical protein